MNGKTAELRLAKLLGRMSRRSRRLVLGVVSIVLLYIAFWTASAVCGRMDYQRVLHGERPRFAFQRWVLTDGGSTGYQGLGYFLIRVHTMRDGFPAVQSYDSGARLRYQLRWLFPDAVIHRTDLEHVEVSPK